MIVFSILLALSLESCRERRKQHEQVTTALGAIHSELQNNREAIAARLPLQRAQLADLQQMANGAADPPLRLTTGLTPPVLMRSAFDTATTTGALTSAAFETVLPISRAYALQGWISRSEDAWLRVVTSPEAWDPKQARRTASLLAGLLTEYVTFETRLETAYDEALGRPRLQEARSPNAENAPTR